MNIFTPNHDATLHHFQWLFSKTNQSRIEFNFVTNLEQIVNEHYKICLVETCTSDSDRWARVLLEYQNLDFDIFDLVIIIDIYCWHNNELIQSFVQQNRIKNYLLITPDNVSTIDEAIYYPHYLFQVFDRNEFSESNHYLEKPFLFDALLGSPKPHRSYVMKRFQENADLLSQSVVSYRDVFRIAEVNALYFSQSCAVLSWLRQQHIPPLDAITTDEIWHPYTSTGYQLIEKYDTLTEVIANQLDKKTQIPDAPFFNKECVIPDNTHFIIPWKIYANTWYSIITETSSGDDATTTVTEKIGRAFFAKRIFILFGAAGSLALLKQLGFRTFDTVIDESYDEIVDSYHRWTAAFDQVEKLAELDPRKIYDQTEEIREHNFNQLREYYLETQNKVQDLIWHHIAYGPNAIRMMHALHKK